MSRFPEIWAGQRRSVTWLTNFLEIVKSVIRHLKSVIEREAMLSRINAVETNPHPDPLPFRKGVGNLRCHRFRVTESDPRRVRLSSPLPARSGERIKVRGASDCIVTAKHMGRCSVANSRFQMPDFKIPNCFA